MDALLGVVLGLAAIVVGALALTGTLSWLDGNTNEIMRAHDWLAAQLPVALPEPLTVTFRAVLVPVRPCLGVHRENHAASSPRPATGRPAGHLRGGPLRRPEAVRRDRAARVAGPAPHLDLPQRRRRTGRGRRPRHPRTRRLGGLAAAALFVAVLPANVQMARDWRDRPAPLRLAAYARLPLQVPLVVSGLRVAAGDRSDKADAGPGGRSDKAA